MGILNNIGSRIRLGGLRRNVQKQLDADIDHAIAREAGDLSAIRRDAQKFASANIDAGLARSGMRGLRSGSEEMLAENRAGLEAHLAKERSAIDAILSKGPDAKISFRQMIDEEYAAQATSERIR